MFKIPEFRSQKYRQYVSTLPCCITFRDGIPNDPHHIKGRGYGGSVKCSDLFCIPLCHELHVEFHMIGWETFEAKYNINQLEIALDTIVQAFNDGVLKYEK